MEKILRGEKVAYDGYLLNATELNDILSKACALDELRETDFIQAQKKEYNQHLRGVRV
jgi:hypothetical protein